MQGHKKGAAVVLLMDGHRDVQVTVLVELPVPGSRVPEHLRSLCFKRYLHFPYRRTC